MKGRIEVILGDITKVEVDAIVNAANEGLWGGGGVDGAIHRAAGPGLAEECGLIREREGGCPTGKAVSTGAGRLPCRRVIHSVGPVWSGGKAGEEELLASCYRSCLDIGKVEGLRSIAFPNISTGVYGFPKPLAAKIAQAVVREWLETNEGIDRVLFVCYDAENYALYGGIGA